MGGAVRDRLLGRDDRRRRRRARRRPAARRRGRSRGRRGGAAFQLSGRVRRLARRRPEHALARGLRAAARRRHRGRPRGARLHRQRDGRAARPAGSCSTRTAAAPTSRRGRCGWSRAARWATTRCATLRAVRLAAELGFEIEPRHARGGVAAHAAAIAGVAPERVFAELKRVVARRAAATRLALMPTAGLLDGRPARAASRCAASSRTSSTTPTSTTTRSRCSTPSRGSSATRRRPASASSRAAGGAARRAARRRAHRGQAMRFAALLHDVAKPQTRGVLPDGRVTFIGHDAAGRRLAARVLRRLRASERLRDYVAALTRHHLRLGFLVHERPLTAARSAATCAPPSPTPPTSRSSPSPTASPPAGATPSRRSPPTSSSRASMLARRAAPTRRRAAAAGPRRRARRASSASRPGPQLGELLAELEEDRVRRRDRDPRRRHAAGARAHAGTRMPRPWSRPLSRSAIASLIASSGYVRGVQRDLALGGQGHQVLQVDVGPDEVADERDLARDDVDRRHVDVLAVADHVVEAAVLHHRDAVLDRALLADEVDDRLGAHPVGELGDGVALGAVDAHGVVGAELLRQRQRLLARVDDDDLGRRVGLQALDADVARGRPRRSRPPSSPRPAPGSPS